VKTMAQTGGEASSFSSGRVRRSYDGRYQKVSRAMVKLLDAATSGSRFSDEEKCNGDPRARQRIPGANADRRKRRDAEPYKVKRIVSHARTAPTR